ncbi:MAG: lysine aminoacylase GenX [Pseudomonadota bacterium]|jgi:lysyl-tRNA synthetase class 2
MRAAKDAVDLFRSRARLRAALREFFSSKNYLEIETPCLVRTPGTEVYLNYFETMWESLGGAREKLYLRSSPELHMKQALAAGCRKIFQIGPCFRNMGELGPWHHPEFTMLEWYHCGSSYREFMQESVELVRGAVRAFGSEARMEVPDDVPAFSVKDAFNKFAGIELVDLDPGLAARAKAAGVVSIRGDEDFDTAFFKVLIEKVEPALAKFPLCILHDYPASQAALAVVEGDVARRFELFAGGVELSNAFFELPGKEANQARIREGAARRKLIGLPEVPEDTDFLDAMARGFPPCAGNALGFDRLLACILGVQDLDAVLPFRSASPWRPHLTQ